MQDLLIRRATALMETRLHDEILALDVERGMCIGFNSTASRVWELLAPPLTFGELQAALICEFNVDPVTCERDVRLLINDLQDRGLVSIGNE